MKKFLLSLYIVIFLLLGMEKTYSMNKESNISQDDEMTVDTNMNKQKLESCSHEKIRTLFLSKEDLIKKIKPFLKSKMKSKLKKNQKTFFNEIWKRSWKQLKKKLKKLSNKSLLDKFIKKAINDYPAMDVALIFYDKNSKPMFLLTTLQDICDNNVTELQKNLKYVTRLDISFIGYDELGEKTEKLFLLQNFSTKMYSIFPNPDSTLKCIIL